MSERVSYFVVTRNGSDRALWLDILRKVGCDVDDAHSPVFVDTMPRKPRGSSIGIEMLPELGKALHAICHGERLVVPHLGHFVSAEVWAAVAAQIAAKGAVIQDATTGQIYDCQDSAVGLAQLKHELARSRGRALTPARMKAGVKGGRKKQNVSAAIMVEILMEFVNPDIAIADIAEKHGFKVSETKAQGRMSMTLLRRIEEATGTMSRSVAIELHRSGKWPPKRKLTR